MKRFHVHVAVDNLDQAIGFYSALFAAQPAVVKPDYAKWMLEDPRVNFAISARGRPAGVDHLGIQVEDQGELQEVYRRLDDAGRPVLNQGETQCCYARSEKSWVEDPAGVSWETFLTTGESTNYGDGSGERGVQIRHQATAVPVAATACCGAKTEAAPLQVEAASACCSR
jgi:catechol 2,3-dioxygenase-like lactoylglutathione lyase family enzyme